MRIAAVVAMAENRVIGKANQLPWRLPADLKYFKQITLGKPIIMGRKTFESIGRVLPGRQNIIISRNTDYRVPEAEVSSSIEGALWLAGEAPEVMVIGGAELYKEMLPRIQRIYLTLVHGDIKGDSYFPALKREEWRELSREAHEADAENAYPYSFVVLERA